MLVLSNIASYSMFELSKTGNRLRWRDVLTREVK